MNSDILTVVGLVGLVLVALTGVLTIIVLDRRYSRYLDRLKRKSDEADRILREGGVDLGRHTLSMDARRGVFVSDDKTLTAGVVELWDEITEWRRVNAMNTEMDKKLGVYDESSRGTADLTLEAVQLSMEKQWPTVRPKTGSEHERMEKSKDEEKGD